MCGFVYVHCNCGKCSQISDFLHSTKLSEIRGPDSKTELRLSESGENFFSFSRLAIRELKDGGQPFSTDNFISCFNGELYNFQQLAAELSGVETAIEIPIGDMQLLALYIATFGIEKLGSIEGMFAGLIYFKDSNELLLIRDRVGEKPLYFFIDSQHIAVASTSFESVFPSLLLSKPDNFLNSLIGGVWDSNIDNGLVHQSLPPGSFVKFDLATLNWSVTKYWEWPKRNKSLNEPVILDLMKKSIKSNLVADVPVALALSSGLDSTFVAAYAAKFSKSQLTSFSIGFEGFHDESVIAAHNANSLGIHHVNLHLSNRDLAASVDSVVESMDFPILDTACISTYNLSKAISKTHKVALTGDGGDELFLSYELIKYERILQYLRKSSPKFVANLVLQCAIAMNFGHGDYIKLETKLRRALSIIVNNQLSIGMAGLSPLGGTEELILFSRIRSQLFPNGVADQAWQTMPVLDFYRNHILPGIYLPKSDRMSMSNQVEFRAPLLNYSLIEEVGAPQMPFLPRAKNLKYFMKRDLDENFHSIKVSKRKRGFSSPFQNCMKFLEVPSWELEPFGIPSNLCGAIWNKALHGDQNAGIAAFAMLVLNRFAASALSSEIR
jgi:asparagine synthase (glutamine-hydrolysing)